jgi:hypothetical protein
LTKFVRNLSMPLAITTLLEIKKASREDWLGMQPLVSGRKESQEKSRTVHKVRQNATITEVVGLFENRKIAAEGFEPPTRGL